MKPRNLRRLDYTLATTYIVAIGMLITGCNLFNPSSDYSATSSYTQKIDVPVDVPLIVRTYCQDKSIVHTSEAEGVVLHMKATSSSAGYHGFQLKPRKVHVSLMKFNEYEQDGSYILESNEYTYIHHAFILDSLKVVVPEGQKVEFEEVNSSDLEGRSNRLYEEEEARKLDTP